uniref:Uncharacterized protein n=1 Tax=Rhizophora mucronata TaxID=61149 RepID=A0A2P2P8E8_RHIMU
MQRVHPFREKIKFQETTDKEGSTAARFHQLACKNREKKKGQIWSRIN